MKKICRADSVIDCARLFIVVTAIFVIAAASTVVAPSAALAWGSVTHMALILEAQDRTKLPVSEDLMGAYLAGSTEPDISALTSSGNAVTSDYHVYHDAAFAEAMKKVAETKNGREKALLLARAEGYKAHLTGDSVAHVQTGYPQTKKAYESTAGNMKANHATVELITDTMSYVRNGKKFDKYKLDYIDAGTLAEVRNEYAKMKGITLETDPKKLNTEILKHRAVVTTDITVAKYLNDKKPSMIKEMSEFTSDSRSGTNGVGGVEPAVDKLVSVIEKGDTISYDKKDDKRKFTEKIAGAASVVVNRVEEAGLGVTEKLIFNVSKIDFIREGLMDFAGKKVSGSNGILGRFLMNITMDKDVSLREALYEAEKPELEAGDSAGALKLARTEVEILRQKAESARVAYENRPWWKLWLFVTKSDKKKYEALKAEYETKSAKLKLMEATPAELAATNSPAPEAIIEASSLGAKSASVVAAEARLRAAYKNYIDAGAPASGPALDAYNQAISGFRNARGEK